MRRLKDLALGALELSLFSLCWAHHWAFRGWGHAVYECEDPKYIWCADCLRAWRKR